jgi:hypothetical protein
MIFYFHESCLLDQNQVKGMPKKFKGENTKSAVAKARKQEQREEEIAKKEKEKEDEYWRDDDKHIAKKQQRKVCIFLKFLNIFQKLQKIVLIILYWLLLYSINLNLRVFL